MNYYDKKSGKEFEELQKMLSKEKIELLNKYFKAMANFYCLIPLQKVFSIINDQYGENYSMEAFEKFVSLAPLDDCSYYGFIHEDHEDESTEPTIEWSIAQESILEFWDAYDEIRGSKAAKEEYYILPKEELLKYEDDLYSPPTPEYNAMLAFLQKHVTDQSELAKEYMSQILFSIRDGDTMPMDSLEFLMKTLNIVPIIQRYERFEELYLNLNNNTRNPHLNGFTPKEYWEKTNHRIASLYTESTDIPKEDLEAELNELMMESQEMDDIWARFAKIPEKLRVLEDTVSKSSYQPEKKKKIGRNDPCPCGSGKKYKKCCGK